jgi:hypothetical protein
LGFGFGGKFFFLFLKLCSSVIQVKISAMKIHEENNWFCAILIEVLGIFFNGIEMWFF